MSEAELHRLQPHLEALGEALHQAVATNPGILAAAKKIQEMGYELVLFLDAQLGLRRLEGAPTEMHEPTPLVKNGEVVQDVFTEDDKHLMRNLRIKF